MPIFLDSFKSKIQVALNAWYSGFRICIQTSFMIFDSGFYVRATPFSFAVSSTHANLFSQRLKSQRTIFNRGHNSASFDTSANTNLFKAIYYLFFCFQNIYGSRYDSYGRLIFRENGSSKPSNKFNTSSLIQLIL